MLSYIFFTSASEAKLFAFWSLQSLSAIFYFRVCSLLSLFTMGFKWYRLISLNACWPLIKTVCPSRMHTDGVDFHSTARSSFADANDFIPNTSIQFNSLSLFDYQNSYTSQKLESEIASFIRDRIFSPHSFPSHVSTPLSSRELNIRILWSFHCASSTQLSAVSLSLSLR